MVQLGTRLITTEQHVSIFLSFLKHHPCTGSERPCRRQKPGSIAARKYENAKEIATPVNFSSGREWNGEARGGTRILVELQ